MNATKRKFNALLQGLGNPDSPEPMDADSRRGAAAAAHDALLQKRRRLGFSESTAPSNCSPSDVTSALNSLASPLRKSTRQAVGAPRPARDALVKYCPGDRAELLKRLATFQELTDWTPKPDRVNEIEWAKRGWICHAKETVRCVLCHRELLVKLNRKQVDGKEVPVLVPSEIGWPHLVLFPLAIPELTPHRGCLGRQVLRADHGLAPARLPVAEKRLRRYCLGPPTCPVRH